VEVRIGLDSWTRLDTLKNDGTLRHQTRYTKLVPLESFFSLLQQTSFLLVQTVDCGHKSVTMVQWNSLIVLL
jgi:hypothetical protein